MVTQDAGDSQDVSHLVMALHQAGADRTISPKDVCGAMTQIEKKKLSPDGWEQILGGRNPGRRWQLIFATGTKQVQEALKTGKGGGFYFPVNAVQGWDSETHKIENGIYLGHILSFAFIGSWQMSKRKMDFTFDRINIKLGPWKFGIPFPENMLGKEEFKSGPFYLFCYVDERVIVARGRGGGLALCPVASDDTSGYGEALAFDPQIHKYGNPSAS